MGIERLRLSNLTTMGTPSICVRTDKRTTMYAYIRIWEYIIVNASQISRPTRMSPADTEELYTEWDVKAYGNNLIHQKVLKTEFCRGIGQDMDTQENITVKQPARNR